MQAFWNKVPSISSSSNSVRHDKMQAKNSISSILCKCTLNSIGPMFMRSHQNVSLSDCSASHENTL